MPFDQPRWELEITAADKTAAAFASVNKNMKALGDATSDAAKKTTDSLSLASALYDMIAGKVQAYAKAAAAAFTVGAVIAKGKEIEDYALKVDKMAKAFKVSTVEAQALDAAARQAGKTAEELNAQLSANQKQLLGQIYKAAFGDTTAILDDVSKASKRLTDAWDDMAEASRQSMVSVFGDVTAGVLNALTEAIKLYSVSIRDAGQFLDRVKNAANPIVDPDPVLREYGIAGSQPDISGPMKTAADLAKESAAETQAALDGLTLKLQTTYEEMAADSERTERYAEDIANLEKRIRDLTASLGTLNATAAGMKGLDSFLSTVDPSKGRGGIGPYMPGASEASRIIVEGTKPPAPAVGGSGGKSDNDSVDAQIKRYEALADVAKRAGATIGANRQKNIEDLQREVRVQEQVEEIAAKLGAKYADADAARKTQLHDEIALYEQRKAANQLALESAQKAEDIEVKLGDGTRARALLERDLARARDTGRASTEALMRVEKQRSEELEHQSLQAARYDDNLGSLGAGFQDAAASYARANDLFAQGGQLFNGVTSAMSDGLDVLSGKSTKTFGQIALDFADMLAKMALQAALSSVFKGIFSGGGGGIGGLLGGGASGTSSGIFDSLFTSVAGSPFMFAAGGTPPIGVPYLVGERGPEVRVDGRPGQIFNRSQWGAVSGGGGGTPPVQRIELVLVDDLLDARIAQGARVQIVRAAPGIVKTANKAVPSLVAQDHRDSGGDWRTRTA